MRSKLFLLDLRCAVFLVLPFLQTGQANHCPVGAVHISGGQQVSDCYTCPAGFYSISNGARVDQATEAPVFCFPCETGADCPGGDVVEAVEGFWRGPDQNYLDEQGQYPRKRASILPCQPEACLGNNTCREGQHGEICGICDEGWVLGNAGLCTNCNGSVPIDTVKAVTISIIIVVGGPLYYLFILRPLVNPFLGISNNCIANLRKCIKKQFQEAEGNDGPKKEVATGSKLVKLQGIFKVVITAFQISTSFLSTFRVDWPAAFTVTMGALWFTRLDLLALPGVVCFMSDVSYTSLLAFKTLGPALLLAAMFLPSAYVTLMGWQNLTHKHIKSGHSLTYYDLYLATVDRFWYAAVLLCYVTFPMCSSTALASFFCIDVGDIGRGMVLGQDPRVDCPREDQGAAFFISVLATLLWPIGLPVGLLVLLEFYNVPALSRDMQNSSVLKAFCDVIGVRCRLSLGSSFLENLCRTLGKQPSHYYSTVAYLKAYSILKLVDDRKKGLCGVMPTAAEDPDDNNSVDDNHAVDVASEDEDAAASDDGIEQRKPRQKRSPSEIQRAKELRDERFLQSFFAKILLGSFDKVLMKKYFDLMRSSARQDDTAEEDAALGEDDNLTTFRNEDHAREALAVKMATEMENIRSQVTNLRKKRNFVTVQLRQARSSWREDRHEKIEKRRKERESLDDQLKRLQRINVLSESNVDARDVQLFLDSFIRFCRPAQARLVQLLKAAKKHFLRDYDEDSGRQGQDDESGDMAADLALVEGTPRIDEDVREKFEELQDEAFVACGYVEAPPEAQNGTASNKWNCTLMTCAPWAALISAPPEPESGGAGHGPEARVKPRTTIVHHLLLEFINLLKEKELVAEPVLAWRQADDTPTSPANLVRRTGKADAIAKYNSIWRGKADFVFLGIDESESHGFGWHPSSWLNAVMVAGDEEFQMSKTKASGRAAFLFETYEVEFWYFEVVEMIRKLVMTSLPLFLFPGKPAQLASVLVIATLFLVVFMRLKPYLDPELDFLQSTTLLAQSATLFYGIMTVMAEEVPDMGVDPNGRLADFVGVLVTLGNLFCAIFPLLYRIGLAISSRLNREEVKAEVDMQALEADLTTNRSGGAARRKPQGGTKIRALAEFVQLGGTGASTHAPSSPSRTDPRERHAKSPRFVDSPGGVPFYLPTGPVFTGKSQFSPSSSLVSTSSPLAQARVDADEAAEEAAGLGGIGEPLGSRQRRSIGRTGEAADSEEGRGSDAIQGLQMDISMADELPAAEESEGRNAAGAATHPSPEPEDAELLLAIENAEKKAGV